MSAGRHSVCCLSVGPHGQGERRRHQLPVSGSRPIIGRSAPLSLALSVHTAFTWLSVWISRSSLQCDHKACARWRQEWFITPPAPPTWGLCVASPGDQVLR